MVSQGHKRVSFHLSFILGPQDCGEGLSDDIHGVIEAAYQAGVTRVTIFQEQGGSDTLQLKSSLEPIVNKDKNITLEVDCESTPDLKSEADMVVSLLSPMDGKAELLSVIKDAVGEAIDAGGDVSADSLLGPPRFANLPDPDLMVFFGGRKTLSKLGVWRGAYSEFAFLDVPWHSFSRQDLQSLLKDFDLRQRRFGAINS